MPQIKNEQLSNIVRKVQGECEFVLKQASAAAEKQELLAAQLTKLTKSLDQTEERIKKSQQEAKVGLSPYKRVAVCASQGWGHGALRYHYRRGVPHAAVQVRHLHYTHTAFMCVLSTCLFLLQSLNNEASSVERTMQRIFQEVRGLEAEMLRTLSEQTSAEKSSSKTAADIRALRQQAESEEMLIAEVQNELARLAVDALNTQGHNDRLRQALQLLDAELKEKVRYGRVVND